MPTPHHSVFTGRMPFLPPNQQRQSTEGMLKLQLINMQKYSRDCVGNMNEQNSGIFFLIQMLWLLSEWPAGCKTMLQQNPSFLVVGAG